MRILVVAAHPDDEVFGCGGTIPLYTGAGHEVHVLIVTKGDELFDRALIEQGRKEALEAHRLLGVSETHFADLPAIKLDTLPQYSINDILLKFFRKIQPNILFIPFLGDINRDHQIVHACSMVAARPPGLAELTAIYSYECLSSTNWSSPGLVPAFIPNTFSDITDTVELKLKAVKTFASQLMSYPHERSAESVLSLSRYRGGFVNRQFAEAFVCMRQVLFNIGAGSR